MGIKKDKISATTAMVLVVVPVYVAFGTTVAAGLPRLLPHFAQKFPSPAGEPQEGQKLVLPVGAFELLVGGFEGTVKTPFGSFFETNKRMAITITAINSVPESKSVDHSFGEKCIKLIKGRKYVAYPIEIPKTILVITLNAGTRISQLATCGFRSKINKAIPTYARGARSQVMLTKDAAKSPG